MSRQGWTMLVVGVLAGVVLTLATVGAVPRGGLLRLCPIPLEAVDPERGSALSVRPE